MRTARVFGIAFFVLLAMTACSRSGKGGARDSGADDGGFGDGNIPVAAAGAELKDIHFDFDSSAIDASERPSLKSAGQWLLDNPRRNVVIEGHCDERGTNEYNMALGERRAKSAFDFLRSLGVSGKQMSTISYGEELPLDPGHSESSWLKNRRAHFATKR